jgi:hypothetical protein
VSGEINLYQIVNKTHPTVHLQQKIYGNIHRTAVPQLNFVEIVQSWHLCQIHKTPLRPMRLYSFIQLGIVAFVKCMETELSMKILKVWKSELFGLETYE